MGLHHSAGEVRLRAAAVLCLLQGSTFGIPGVEQHAHFLRDVKNAEAIRSKLIDNIAKAGIPGGE
jgi:NADH:ubiquinone reductase (non-electrogenic)